MKSPQLQSALLCSILYIIAGALSRNSGNATAYGQRIGRHRVGGGLATRIGNIVNHEAGTIGHAGAGAGYVINGIAKSVGRLGADIGNTVSQELGVLDPLRLGARIGKIVNRGAKSVGKVGQEVGDIVNNVARTIGGVSAGIGNKVEQVVGNVEGRMAHKFPSEISPLISSNYSNQ